jgi:hypothetical protein
MFVTVQMIVLGEKTNQAAGGIYIQISRTRIIFMRSDSLAKNGS